MSLSDICQLDGNSSIESNQPSQQFSIPVYISERNSSTINPIQNRAPVRRTIKRNNLILQSVSLPTVMNINPRSIYNKSDELPLLLDQYNADIICMSETWERDNQTLEELLDLPDYQIITNVKQRDFKGGKPAILVNESKYIVKKLCPDPVTVPVGVEAVWALVTPRKHCSQKHKYIAICSLYYRGPKSTKKQELFDHIAETFHFLSSKYGSNLQFIIAGDTNRLNLSPILNLSPNLKQVVKTFTRLNPEAILDPIITTLWKYYQEPVTKPPINPNVNSKGKPSDHLIVIMEPLSAELDIQPRQYQFIKTQPITQSGLNSFGRWIISHNWHELYQCVDIHEKAQLFQETLLMKYKECFPIKIRKFSSDDQPWVTERIKQLDRLQKREFSKNHKSRKWISLNEAYLQKCEIEKKKYYENIVMDLKTSNPSKWYSKLKRMSGQDKDKLNDNEINVAELDGIYDKLQGEIIADHYAQISNSYEPIKPEDFSKYMDLSSFTPVIVEPEKIKKIIRKMNHKAATVEGDLPVKIIKEFEDELAQPLSHLINNCLAAGIYPNLWKIENVTPVPKTFPPEKLKDLRKISGLLNFSKITDKVIAELLADDMLDKRDKSQYGNQKNLSTQHYLVKMLHKILVSVDRSSQHEAFCAILHMVDWAQAFDRQSHKLGVQSFIDNGVRPALIPVLVNFFQDRKMRVKWKGHISTFRNLNGGGPQGGTLGIEEYLSQSNDNCDFLPDDEKFKYIDDLSMLEIINLISIGIASYNFKAHVASDIGVKNSYLPAENIQSQQFINSIEQWTDRKEMKLNSEKSKFMLINFTKNYQVNTRLYMEEKLLTQVSKTRLLGIILRDDLSFKSNTEFITKKAYKRMSILHKLYQFDVPVEDLVNIYILYIRSVLEQSAVVWHSSITKGEQMDIERVQKCAFRIILKEKYDGYENALNICNLDSLKARRKQLCLKFARKSIKYEKTQDIFPLNSNASSARVGEKFEVTFARTNRLANSAVPYMQRLLNAHEKQKKRTK